MTWLKPLGAVVIALAAACSSGGGRLGVTNSAPAPDRPAQPTRVVKPQYPVSARTSRHEGIVQVRVVVNEKGVVTRAEIVRSPDDEEYYDPALRKWVPVMYELEQPCVDAVLQWRFRPAYSNGHPIESTFVIPLEFAASNEPE